MVSIKKHIEMKFGDEIRFFKGWIAKPKAVGAILPTSSVTANRMASIIDTGSALPVLELGPGTGVITKAILARGMAPEKIISVEYSQDFYQHLQVAYPGVNFIHGDAFNLDETLKHMGNQKFDAIISGIPLLNFPMSQRVELLMDLLDRIPDGRPVVQFSYGPSSPIMANPKRYVTNRFAFIMRNIPPVQIWTYRRA